MVRLLSSSLPRAELIVARRIVVQPYLRDLQLRRREEQIQPNILSNPFLSSWIQVCSSKYNNLVASTKLPLSSRNAERLETREQTELKLKKLLIASCFYSHRISLLLISPTHLNKALLLYPYPARGNPQISQSCPPPTAFSKVQ